MADIDRLKSLAKSGKLSRREFIVGALSAGIAVPVAEGMFMSIARAEPKKGGLFRMATPHGATTDTLDPGLYTDTMIQFVGWGSSSNSLTVVDAKGNILPDLAESYEPSEGASKWMFKIRKGTTFHNGKDVTADDVVASFRHHLKEGTKSAAKSLLESVKDIKADDKSTVVFTLNGGNADFPYIASDYHIPIMPAKENGDADWESGIRTGAYTIEKLEPGVRAKLKRAPNYYGNAWFDELEVTTIADHAARQSALLTGAVDHIIRPDLKTLGLLQQNPEFTISELTGFGHYTFPMLVDVAPFDNVDVRLALKYAMDREEIVKKIFLGHASAGNDNPISPAVKFATNPEPIHTFDPEKAKFHLKKAGLSNLKVDINLSDAAFNGCVDAGVLYQASAAKCGIDINVVREAADGYWDNVWLKKPWCASYWSGRPTCDWMFTTVYAKGANWNETRWANERFNELLVQARAETDDAKRSTMYTEMQQLVHDDCGQLVIVFNNIVEASAKKLAHGDIAANWELDGLRIGERWWFA